MDPALERSEEADEFQSEAWKRAIVDFTADLDGEEKKVYLDASLQAIWVDTQVIERRHKTDSRSRRYLEKLQVLVQAISQYGEALNVYAGIYPLATSSLWGSLRVVLHVRLRART